jgi:hypothetical protein
LGSAAFDSKLPGAHAHVQSHHFGFAAIDIHGFGFQFPDTIAARVNRQASRAGDR